MDDDKPLYLFDPARWDTSILGNIPALIADHLWYTLLTLVIGAVIAIPIGLYIGHTGRFAFLAINAGNLGRSLPTLGLICLLVTMVGLGLVPVLIALVILAIPPILTATYAGLRAASDHSDYVVDAVSVCNVDLGQLERARRVAVDFPREREPVPR